MMDADGEPPGPVQIRDVGLRDEDALCARIALGYHVKVMDSSEFV